MTVSGIDITQTGASLGVLLADGGVDMIRARGGNITHDTQRTDMIGNVDFMLRTTHIGIEQESSHMDQRIYRAREKLGSSVTIPLRRPCSGETPAQAQARLVAALQPE